MMRDYIDIITESETQERLRRAVAMGFDTSRAWYHGSKESFAEFSQDFVGLGTDQNGSGFYFTSDPDDAAYYSGQEGNIMAVFLRLRGEVSRNKPLSREILQSIIEAGNEEDLWNYGDIGHLGKDRVLRDAVDSYALLDAFNAMICLSNDFYKQDEGKFIDVFSRLTGCNHVMDNKGSASHCVMLNPRDIRSVHANFLKDNSSDLLS
jgi:hypothetical protein